MRWNGRIQWGMGGKMGIWEEIWRNTLKNNGPLSGSMKSKIVEASENIYLYEGNAKEIMGERETQLGISGHKMKHSIPGMVL